LVGVFIFSEKLIQTKERIKNQNSAQDFSVLLGYHQPIPEKKCYTCQTVNKYHEYVENEIYPLLIGPAGRH
jgi:hypothetical protein